MVSRKEASTSKSPTAPQASSNAVARKPSQDRSRIRFQALLDATQKLLSSNDINSIGLYDIAKEAKVPAASAYHFFPTKEAALLAVAERYLDELKGVIQAPVDRSRLMNWPDLIDAHYSRTVNFLNSNPAFCRLFLAGTVISEIRSMDVEYVASQAGMTYQWFDQYFVMPYLPNHEMQFSVLIGIYDGIWMTSYARHGLITEEFAREGRTAAIAYCKTFLPEVLPIRAPDDKLDEKTAKSAN